MGPLLRQYEIPEARSDFRI